MKHLSDEELVGQAYGEGAGGAEQHLKDCRECGQAYAALESDLAEIGRLEPPPRDESYGERVWQTIASSLPAYPARRQSWMHMGLLRRLSYAAVCALLVAVAFYAGRRWEHNAANKPPAIAQTKQPQPKQPVLVVVLGDHLDRSERLLVELKHAEPGSAEMASPLRDEARSLLAANRVCRRNASEADDPALTTALDHLDRLLDELASQPDGLDAATIARLQDEMKSDSLLFEVRVLRSRIPNRNPESGTRSIGGKI